MCAIVDANVAHEAFGKNATAAGVGFRNWITGGSGRLAVGGLLMRELERSAPGFREWAIQARLSGQMRVADDGEIAAKAETLRESGLCRSNDHHVIALAQVSGARLLYSNDQNLHRDFRNKRLIDNPRGSVYSTLESKDFTRNRRDQLRRRDLCASAS